MQSHAVLTATISLFACCDADLRIADDGDGRLDDFPVHRILLLQLLRGRQVGVCGEILLLPSCFFLQLLVPQ